MNKRIYNLDGLRFLASIIVITRHFQSVIYGYHRPGISGNDLKYIAQPSLTLFFVISGFIITYVLKKDKKIDLLKFYRNRGLRIWPLYYFIVLFVFFLQPHIEPLTYYPSIGRGELPLNKFVGYLLFLPNTTEFLYGSSHYLGMTWSLGVEEFFYLFFPFMILFIPERHQIKSFLALIVFYISITIIADSIVLPANFSYRYELILHEYIPRYRLYAFLIGAIVCIVWQKGIIAKLLARKNAVILIWLFILFCLLAEIPLGPWKEIFYASLFGIGIYGMVSSGLRLRLLDNKWVNYLGKISYGTYLFHNMVIVLVINLFGAWVPANNEGAIILWLAIIFLTLLVSVLSYEYFEKIFLRLKKE